MSTRWYPIYQKGNPQLRVFLPNFWMRIIKPKKSHPPQVVVFECPVEMTKYDVKNYLEKIYKIPVVNVRTYIHMGQFRKAVGANYIVKDDDVKRAIVHLPPNEKFTFPNVFPEEKVDSIEEHLGQMKEMEKDFKNNTKKTKNRPGIPTWFVI